MAPKQIPRAGRGALEAAGAFYTTPAVVEALHLLVMEGFFKICFSLPIFQGSGSPCKNGSMHLRWFRPGLAFPFFPKSIPFENSQKNLA